MATTLEALAIAVQYHQAGQLQQAEAIYRQILQADSNQAEALHMLGVLAAQTGRSDVAVQYMSQAVSRQPGNTVLRDNLAKARNDLGIVLMEQDRWAEAIMQHQEALRLKPHFVEAHINLGNALKGQGRLADAAVQFQEALRLRPNSAEAHNNLGAVLEEHGKLAEALAQFGEALRIKPDYPEAHHNMGIALKEQGRWAEALVEYREAVRLRPDYVDAHYNLGLALSKQGQLSEALEHYRQALRLRPDHADAHFNMGVVHNDLGDFEKAVASFRESLRLNPNLVGAYFNLGQLAAGGHYTFTDDDVEAIRALLANGQAPNVEQGSVHFALANYLDRLGRYDEAFEYYRQGNTLQRQYKQLHNRGFDRGKAVALVENILAFFNAGYFERVRSFGIDTEKPVFVVGMPRSGTTLVEQILSSHPQVFGAGELNDIRQMTKELPGLLNTPDCYPTCMSRIDKQFVETQGQHYLQRLSQLGGNALRVINKLPVNHQHLGLIYTMYPKARIIHCRRDPLDACLSCYTQHFEQLNFTNSLEDIALVYQLYQRTMEHWQISLPTTILEVQYEDLVENQEAVSRAMIAFCGLTWDDRCLSFYETQRAVQTASSIQVRQPMYRSSVGRWKHYEAHIGPLIEALQKSKS